MHVHVYVHKHVHMAGARADLARWESDRGRRPVAARISTRRWLGAAEAYNPRLLRPEAAVAPPSDLHA